MVDVGWRLPSGEFLTQVNDTEEIHVSEVGDSALADNTTKDVFIVTIFAVSYQHAGIYSCEVRDTATPGAGWITAELDLQLRGILCRTNHKKLLLLTAKVLVLKGVIVELERYAYLP